MAASLVACTPRDQWVKESASAAEFRRDLDWCHALGYQERSYLDDRYYFLADTVELRTFNACMRERGYRREPVGEAE